MTQVTYTRHPFQPSTMQERYLGCEAGALRDLFTFRMKRLSPSQISIEGQVNMAKYQAQDRELLPEHVFHFLAKDGQSGWASIEWSTGEITGYIFEEDTTHEPAL